MNGFVAQNGLRKKYNPMTQSSTQRVCSISTTLWITNGCRGWCGVTTVAFIITLLLAIIVTNSIEVCFISFIINHICVMCVSLRCIWVNRCQWTSVILFTNCVVYYLRSTGHCIIIFFAFCGLFIWSIRLATTLVQNTMEAMTTKRTSILHKGNEHLHKIFTHITRAKRNWQLQLLYR